MDVEAFDGDAHLLEGRTQLPDLAQTEDAKRKSLAVAATDEIVDDLLEPADVEREHEVDDDRLPSRRRRNARRIPDLANGIEQNGGNTLRPCRGQVDPHDQQPSRTAWRTPFSLAFPVRASDKIASAIETDCGIMRPRRACGL